MYTKLHVQKTKLYFPPVPHSLPKTSNSSKQMFSLLTYLLSKILNV